MATASSTKPTRHNVAIYERLGVLLADDDVRPESAYNDELADTVAELEADGVAVVDDGALCVFVDGYEAPLIIRKSDGGFTYGTTDLAAIRYRVRELGGDAAALRRRQPAAPAPQPGVPGGGESGLARRRRRGPNT